jgi:signal transduction histidine kinase/CheY-like chemotaxis protein
MARNDSADSGEAEAGPGGASLPLSDLDAMTRLLRVGSLFLRDGNLEQVLGEIVDAAIAISGADFGNVQILEPESGDLRIAAHRGFPAWWVQFWNQVAAGHGVCGTALERGERVIVEDVEHSPIFDVPSLEMQRRAGVQAVQSTPLIGRSGKPVGMLSTHYRRPTRPISGALRTLDLLARQAADILERASAEQALKEANLRLVEADRRKNQFLAVISHELRNPLAPLRNSVRVLAGAVPGEEAARRAQAVIGRQVEHLTHLVDDLLEVGRIVSNRVHLRRENLDLNELARGTVEDHRGVFAGKGVALEVHTAPGAVAVNGDRTRLAQVIGNLLHNAAKFTPKGGRTLVAVEADGPHRQAIVRVQDSGRGMAPETLPHIFEPFIQADSSLAHTEGGLGLGLAIVKGLVELHAGSVEVGSAGMGKGATFTVSLPLETAAPVQPSPGRAAAVTAARRVLVIDDNVDSADTLGELLSLGGHETQVAYDGPDGIESARIFGPDVVLCDIGLPGMDGYEVARAIRADLELRHVRLVALSGYARPEDVAKAKEAGFDAHIPKPPNIDLVEKELSTSPAGSRAV